MQWCKEKKKSKKERKKKQPKKRLQLEKRNTFFLFTDAPGHFFLNPTYKKYYPLFICFLIMVKLLSNPSS